MADEYYKGTKKKKRKKKKKQVGGLGWGDSANYEAVGSGTGFDGGGAMGESMLRSFIRNIMENTEEAAQKRFGSYYEGSPSPKEIAEDLLSDFYLPETKDWLIALVQEGIHGIHGRYYSLIRMGLATVQHSTDSNAENSAYVYPSQLGIAVAKELKK